MLSGKRIYRRFGECICRRCVNKKYRVHLTRENCKYGYYYRCPICGEDHNMVVGFKGLGRLKMLFRF